ncbi:MAG: hypothetical protein KKB39_04470 [Nanoarchaeota archaeon]|nr:hypothetical protein [Nanoarchaeota archaeon]
MKLRNLLALGTFGLASLVGGCQEVKIETNQPQVEYSSSIKGEVISMELASSREDYRGKLSLVLKNEAGQFVLAHQHFTSTLNLTDVAAIIRSEMNDEDNESVELRGIQQDGNAITFNEVRANGYTIKIK